MNWIQRQTDKHQKEWRAERSRYRIIWRDQVWSVAVLPGYQCCVRVFIPPRNCSIWELVERKRPLYRTFQMAKNACEKHNDPSYKPVRQVSSVKRSAPVKSCPECGASLHTRKRLCDCGHNFPRSIKSMRKSAEKKAIKQAAKKKAAKKTAKKAMKKATKKATKKPRKAPMKSCPVCGIKLHVRKATCDCGHKFPRKRKNESS